MTPKEYTINPELRDLLSPLSPTQFEKLETEILADGCTNPLTIWGETIVDGHNRYEICTKHGITFDVNQKSFTTLDDAKIWIWQNQGSRRNLTRFQRAETVLKMKSAVAARSKAKQLSKLRQNTVMQKSARRTESKATRLTLAEFANVSHATLDQVEYILKFADDETLNKLRWDETTINKEYRRIKKEQDALAPPKPKKSQSKSKAETTAFLFNEESEVNDSETDSTSKQPVKKGAKPKRETVTISLKSSPKVKDQYSCGIKFEPDPDDDFFDWISEEERAELNEIRETCPNRVVPQIHNFTIQNIPEHKPDQLLACLFSLFKVRYREKLAYGLLEKMFNEDSKELALDIVTTLYHKFQNQ